MTDHPFYEVVALAYAHIARDPETKLFQKWTCEGCLSRQIMTEPNRFFTSGQCEECGHITNIRLRGCNYLFMGTPEAALRAMDG